MSDSGLTIDQRGLRTSGGRLRTYLPDELVARYEPLHNLNVSAGQADLVVARHRSSGEEVVVKLYRNAEQLDREVMERLYRADDAHVVRLLEHGETDGEPWEVQEYCPLGTLTDYRMNHGGQLSETQARSAVIELADAIDHIHSLNITHRDLKPENILVRSLEPLDLVLTDFGVAAEQIATVQLQTVAASWVWAAPEVHTKGAVSRDIDWWAMGAIVHQLLTGRHPLSGADGRLPGDLKVIRAGVVDGLYSTETVAHERWRDLVDGLLSYEPTQRWGYDEVHEWLNGQNPEVVRTSPVAEQLRAAKNAPPEETREHMLIWNGAAIRTGLELVRAMRAEWGRAAEFLDKWPDKPLRDWLMTRPQGKVMADVLDLEANGDGRLIRLQARFDPDGPLEFMGRAVNDTSLNEAIAAVERWDPESGGEASRAHVWLDAIRDRHVLMSIAAAVESDSPRLIRADQLLNDWDQTARGFLTTVREHIPLEHSNKAAEAAEKRFAELRGFQFAAALSGDIPGDYSDRARQTASRIQGTLDALAQHELLPKASPWASKQRVRKKLLALAAQVTDSSSSNLGLHIPASVYLGLMDKICAHDLAALREQAERIRRERQERERAEQEAKERTEREARERAAREARQAVERAEAEKKRLEDATRYARTGAKNWWTERLVLEERELQATENRRIEEAVRQKREELGHHEATYEREKANDTNGALLAIYLVLSAGAVSAVIYASNRWGAEAVAWVIGLSAFVYGGLLWIFSPLLGVLTEISKGKPAKRRLRTARAEIARDIAQLQPRHIRLVRIPVDTVGRVIGKGGETVKRIAKTGVTVDIQGWHEVAPPRRVDLPSWRARTTTSDSSSVCIRKEKWEAKMIPAREWVRPSLASPDRGIHGYSRKNPYWRYIDKDFLHLDPLYFKHGNSQYVQSDWRGTSFVAFADDDEWYANDAPYQDPRRFDDFGGRIGTDRYGTTTTYYDYWDWFEDPSTLPPAPVPPTQTYRGEKGTRWKLAYKDAVDYYKGIRFEYERIFRGPPMGHGGIVVAVVTGDTLNAADMAVNAIKAAMIASPPKRDTEQEVDRKPPTISVGQEFSGLVKKITEYGSFVELLPSVDGLLHISELRPLNDNKYVERVEDVLHVGQVVKVTVSQVKPDNRYSLKLVQ